MKLRRIFIELKHTRLLLSLAAVRGKKDPLETLENEPSFVFLSITFYPIRHSLIIVQPFASISIS